MKEFRPLERGSIFDANGIQNCVSLRNNERISTWSIEDFAHDFNSLINSALLNQPAWCFRKTEDEDRYDDSKYDLASNWETPSEWPVYETHAVVKEVGNCDTEPCEKYLCRDQSTSILCFAKLRLTVVYVS